MKTKFSCVPYKSFNMSNLSTIDSNLPKAEYFDTLPEAKQYKNDVKKLGYNSYIEEVEQYYPFPNAKVKKYKDTISYRTIRKVESI